MGYGTGEAVGTIDRGQREAARVVGLAYLLALPFAIFPEFYVAGQLIVSDNAAETARNVMMHERLFRLGIASNLSVCALDVVLIAALYRVLRPVHRGLALLAVFWRLIETAVLVVAILNDFEVLRVLGAADDLRAFETDRLQAMAALSIGAHHSAYSVALLFTGLGSTVFCFLWFRSRFVPKALAAFGVFASFLLVPCMFARIIFPELPITVVYYGGPIFLFELTMGFWLLLRGLPHFVEEVRHHGS